MQIKYYEVCLDRDTLVHTKTGHIETIINVKEINKKHKIEDYYKPMTSLMAEILRAADATAVS